MTDSHGRHPFPETATIVATAAPAGPGSSSLPPASLDSVPPDPDDSLPADQPLRQALDLLDSAVGFFRADRRLIHGNRALRRILAEGGPLSHELAHAVAEITSECRTGRYEGDVRKMVDRPVEVEGRLFRIRGGFVGMDLWSTGASIVVTMEEVRAVEKPAMPEVPRRRFRLTPREADIAMLLAEGRTNDEIASALFLSPYTVRNYTRRVLRKLQVRNRAQVGPRLRSSK